MTKLKKSFSLQDYHKNLHRVKERQNPELSNASEKNQKRNSMFYFIITLS